MSKQEKMVAYIERTKLRNTIQYDMDIEEYRELYMASKYDTFNAIYLAFCYGRAKGYRMAKKEVRR